MKTNIRLKKGQGVPASLKYAEPAVDMLNKILYIGATNDEEGGSDFIKILDETAVISKISENKEVLNCISSGEGLGSIIISKTNENVANGDYSIVGGYSSNAITDYSVALGYKNISGSKGFYIRNIDYENKKIYLSNIKYDTGFNDNTDSTDVNFITPEYDVGDEFSILGETNDGGENHYHFCGKIVSITNNVITYNVDLPFTELKDTTDEDFPMFLVPKKPNVGNIVVGIRGFAEGDSNIAGGLASHAEGRGNIAAGKHAHVEGRNTKAGYSAHAEGLTTTASGMYSHAEGNNTNALGKYSHTEGKDTLASTKGAHAEGDGSKAQGIASHAEGYQTKAIVDYAHSEGLYTTAEGIASHAEGSYSHSKGTYSHSEGLSTKAYGTYSHAEGFETQANASTSHAEGWKTVANATTAHAEGYMSHAEGESSHAEGEHTYANSQGSHSEGEGTTADGEASHAEGFGSKAQGLASHAEGHTVIANGYASHAEGEGSKSLEFYSHSEGYYTNSTGFASHSEGENTTASGSNSHAEGLSTNATGKQSHAEGESTKATNINSHAEGLNTQAKGLASHAEGNNTKATAEWSHAEGLETTASGAVSHAEGRCTTASKKSSHAEGEWTSAINDYAHAEGYNTIASGQTSHTEGTGTFASGNNQHVQGRYNLKDLDENQKATNKYAHIVGNGNSDSNRSNAHTLDWNGNAYYAGDVYVNTIFDEYEEEGKKLATEEYVNDKVNDISISGEVDLTSVYNMINNLHYYCNKDIKYDESLFDFTVETPMKPKTLMIKAVSPHEFTLVIPPNIESHYRIQVLGGDYIEKIIIPRNTNLYYQNGEIATNEDLKTLFPNLKTIVRIDEDGVVSKYNVEQ